MSEVPQRIRDKVLIRADFSCCACGQKFFCDVHHLKPISEGGSHAEKNLIVLCPSCHRMAHRKGFNRNQLMELWSRHTDQIKYIVESKSHLSQIQDMQISSLLHSLCIESPYPRDEFLERPRDEVYFIVFDFVEIGLVCDPTNKRPIMVSDNELPQLLSIEVVTNPFRFMFLEAMQKAAPKPSREYRLVRLDIILSLETEYGATGVEDKDDDAAQVISTFKEQLIDLIKFTKNPVGQ